MFTSKLSEFLSEHRKEVYLLLRKIVHVERPLLLKSEITKIFDEFCEENHAALKETVLGELISHIEVCVMQPPWIGLSVRTNIGEWKYYRFHVEEVSFEEISVREYLRFEEQIVDPHAANDDWILEFDLGPFNRGFPLLKEKRSIGKGVEFLDRHLSTLLFSPSGEGLQKLFEFLHVHKYQGQQLMLNNRISSVAELQKGLREAETYLKKTAKNKKWATVEDDLQTMGFEKGWGNTVARIMENMGLLLDTLEAPDPNNLQKFLGRIPMVFNIVILSPHGYFGQSKVLGFPDTGGQVVYILDQVRALETEMLNQIEKQGLDITPQIVVITRLIPEAGNTTCDQREESILGTKHAKILRIPFRNSQGEIIPHWISRFEIWPHLESFTLEVEKEIMADMGGKPDIIVGNYTDGNVVATLLSQRLGVTQCNIAHALEKNKYLFSALYWKDNEHQYHFSSHFTADLLAMNAADFIISSTYQEIAGTDDSIGQYESYSSFTMPGLYRVINGISVYDPKFNIVSPGCDADVYFPYSHEEARLKDLHSEIGAMIFGEDQTNARGTLEDRDKPLIFTIARLDYIKNITGLVDWYGQNDRLREMANLFVISGNVDFDKSNDEEEKKQIQIMYELLEKYDLWKQVRWHIKESDKNLVGEIYRYVADHKGIFVQPALFEAFGLTVIESMSSGLPTFATQYGGPLEIIEHGVSGFHIDPNRGDIATKLIFDFFEQAQKGDHWQQISDASIKRIEECYTWQLYAKRLLNLSRIYGFWKYVSNLEREETQRYLGMFYSVTLRKLFENVGK
ncbi:MAG: sucrose synthase [SAR324 cluster bacterium]|nr:sucrose synthase [SAR324 cluster bacterium]